MSTRPGEAAAPSAVVDKTVVLVVASMASFLGSLMSSSVNIAIPSIGREFAADAVTLSWIPTVFLMVLAMFMVPAGRLADIYGRKKVFLLGVLAWTVTSVLCGLATSAVMLIALRVFQAIAGAMFTGNATAIVTSVYPPRERGRALCINVAAVYVGLSLGPSAGGVLTEHLGWQSLFFLNALMGAIIAVLIIWKMGGAEWTGAKGEKLDITGSGIFALTLLAIMYGFSVLPAMLGAWLILAGAACLAAFVWWESRVDNPVLDINLFRRNIVFALSNLAALTNYAATAAIGFLLSLYLQYVKGLDPQTAGLILLAQPFMMVILSPIAGRISDRIEPRIVASTGMALTTLGLVLLAFLNDSSSLTYIVIALLVAGVGFGLFSSPNTNAVMGSVERSYLGVASATLGVMRSVGQMLSLGIATLIIAVYVGNVQITPQYHAAFSSGFRLAFIIFAVLCLIGIFSSMARGKLHGGAAAGRMADMPSPGGR